jgi:hypothetical protein
MNAFQVACIIFGGLSIVAALAAAVAITIVPRFQTRDAAFIVATASIVGGPLIVSIATPDWSPITMASLYAPFLLTGLYGATIAALRGRAANSHNG